VGVVNRLSSTRLLIELADKLPPEDAEPPDEY
jgi:hypothetical protein